MYFSINPDCINKEEIKNFIMSFSEIKIIKDYSPYWDNFFYISLKTLRKFKILSLIDNDIKSKLSKLETILNNKEIINNFGDNLIFFETTQTCPTSTTTPQKIKLHKSQKNNFPNFDIHKINKKLKPFNNVKNFNYKKY